MKKKTILFLSILVLGIISLFSYQTKNIKIDKKEVKTDFSHMYSGVYLYTTIDKTDENNNPLSKVRFIMKAYNDVFEYDAMEEQSNDYYNYFFDVEDNRVSPIALYNMLSPVQKNKVEQITTLRDIINNFDKENYNCDSRRSVEGVCQIFLPTAFIIEEIKVPTGYVKDKKIIPGVITLRYSVSNLEVESEAIDTTIYTENSLSSSATLTEIEVRDYSCSGESYDYGEIDIEDLTGFEGLPIYRSENLEPEKAIASIKEQKYVQCQPIKWKNQKGEVNLSATAFVNDVESFTTKPNQNIDYKIVVENTGSVDAIDNIIKAEVPEGFIYVTGSANFKGQYKDGYIEWNVSRISKGQNIELTYKLFAPKEVTPGIDYTSKAIVENFAMERGVESNKTMVRLALNNPVTISPIALVVAILCISIGVFIITYRSYLLKQLEQ